MNKCDRHKKEHVGSCMWCGKKVCEFCVAKQEGTKKYCEKCAIQLGGVRREPLPRIGKMPLPASGRKFKFENGYLVMDGGE